jgi:putative copper export protein
MADIRVERKSGGKAWLWILIVVVLLIVAALLLDRAGYVDLPIDLGNADGAATPAQLATGVVLPVQEA